MIQGSPAEYLPVLAEWGLWLCTIVIAASGLLDVLFDSYYAYSLFFNGRGRVRQPSGRGPSEQLIAVMIPAFREEAVLADTLTRLLENCRYSRFTIFVGTYQNDPETSAVAQRFAVENPHVVQVLNEKLGPTTKADCLNTILASIVEVEKHEGEEHQIFVVQDAEDEVHPDALATYNRLMPTHPAVQLPILPKADSRLSVFHWVYADEFAESEFKDVRVRSRISGFVPFLGTGSAISRGTLDQLMRAQESVFLEDSLVEDYNLSLRLHRLGIPVHFYRSHSLDRPRLRPAADPEFLCNWAAFPEAFVASVRQRSRWITGISLQEWVRSGWGPGLLLNLVLLRDRRSGLAPLPVIGGAICLASLFALHFFDYAFRLQCVLLNSFTTPPLSGGPPGLQIALLVPSGLALYRCTQRFLLVNKIYGTKQALLSILRFPLSGVVNLAAASIALALFCRARVTGQRLTWAKTEHKPSPSTMPEGAAL